MKRQSALARVIGETAEAAPVATSVLERVLGKPLPHPLDKFMDPGEDAGPYVPPPPGTVRGRNLYNESKKEKPAPKKKKDKPAFGIWKKKPLNALAHQKKLRGEWDDK